MKSTKYRQPNYFVRQTIFFLSVLNRLFSNYVHGQLLSQNFGAAVAPHWECSVPKIGELSSYA